VLAPVPVVSIKAGAKTHSKVTVATSRALASFLGTITTKDIFSRWALLLRAVRTTVSIITLASHVLIGIPGDGVRRTSQGGKGLLWHANSTSRAIIRTLRTLTSLAIVVLEAPTLSTCTIASSLVGALHAGMGQVLTIYLLGRPRSALGTRPLGAIMSHPRWITVGAVVACALV